MEILCPNSAQVASLSGGTTIASAIEQKNLEQFGVEKKKKQQVESTVKAAAHPPTRERLGEIAEELLQILAEERARKKPRGEKSKHGTRDDAA